MMKRLTDWLTENSAAIIFTPVNRFYLTGFSSSLGYLVVTKNDTRLFVDGRYITAAKQQVNCCEVVELKNIANDLKEFLYNKNVTTVFIEEEISVSTYNMFLRAFPEKTIFSDESLSLFLNGLRKVKTEKEISFIKNAQSIAEKAFEETLNFVRVGVSEKQIVAELEYRMMIYGSQMPSFNTIVVSGENSALPHGVPNEKNIIKRGDFIVFDFGAVYNGYHSDMTRTIAVGYASDKMYEVYNTVLNAQNAAEKIVKDGVLASNVDIAARSVIENAGYGEYFVHSTGHSLGLEVHEMPTVSFKSKDILKSGNIITNEPGIYIPNEFGVRIEDMLLVCSNGCDNLTSVKKSLIIV